MFNLTGKTALVTGSSQGIGKEIAKALADCGAKVIVHGSRESEKLSKAAEYAGASNVVAADLSDPAAADNLYAKTGDVDILVLNASVQFRSPWDEITDRQIDTQLTVNFKNTLKLIQKYAPYMKERGYGRIVTVGSVQQTNPHPQMAVYAASKSAVMNLVTNLAAQLAPFGITVNNLSPGAIATPRNDEALSDAQYLKKVVSGIPAGFVGDPKDMNGAAVLLCSDEGRYITGTDVVVDGGMHL